MKNDCSSESFGVRIQGGLFQLQSADKVTSGVSCLKHRLYIGISSVGLRVVAFWGELNS